MSLRRKAEALAARLDELGIEIRKHDLPGFANTCHDRANELRAILAESDDGMADCMQECRVALISAGVIDESVPPILVADAVIRAVSARKAYEAGNPLGGPATMFEAAASRIRAGEDFNAVLRDYGLRREGEGEAVATLHCDGFWTHPDGRDPFQHPGPNSNALRLDVYAAPPDTVPRAEYERVVADVVQWTRAYEFVTDILPLDDRNLCRDPVCPQNMAEQDRHRVDVLIQRAERAEAEQSTYRAFWEKHALGPKRSPSCLVCGKSAITWPPAIQHAELPGIVVCQPCRDRAALTPPDTVPRSEYASLLELVNELKEEVSHQVALRYCYQDSGKTNRIFAELLSILTQPEGRKHD